MSPLPSIVVCSSGPESVTSTSTTPTPTLVRRVDLCHEDGSESGSAGVNDNGNMKRRAFSPRLDVKKSGGDTVGTAAETEEDSSIVAPRPPRKSVANEFFVEERDELAAKFVVSLAALGHTLTEPCSSLTILLSTCQGRVIGKGKRPTPFASCVWHCETDLPCSRGLDRRMN